MCSTLSPLMGGAWLVWLCSGALAALTAVAKLYGALAAEIQNAAGEGCAGSTGVAMGEPVPAAELSSISASTCEPARPADMAWVRCGLPRAAGAPLFSVGALLRQPGTPAARESSCCTGCSGALVPPAYACEHMLSWMEMPVPAVSTRSRQWLGPASGLLQEQPRSSEAYRGMLDLAARSDLARPPKSSASESCCEMERDACGMVDGHGE